MHVKIQLHSGHMLIHDHQKFYLDLEFDSYGQLIPVAQLLDEEHPLLRLIRCSYRRKIYTLCICYFFLS